MNRDNSIDIFRGLASLIIVAVHIYPQETFRHIFNFCVPMMVFCSGVSFALSGRTFHGVADVLSFYKKRILRLVIPCWIFLTFWYICKLDIAVFTGNKRMLDFNEIFNNYLLLGGWYIWIIRVFLLIAIYTPLLAWISRHISKKKIILISMLFLAVYERFHISDPFSLSYNITMCIPYLAIFSVGYAMNDKKGFDIYGITLLTVCTLCYLFEFFSVYLNNGHFVSNQLYKYPPLLYYTSYGLTITIIFWLFRDRITDCISHLKIGKLFTFLGRHSLWFYFLHIPVISILGRFPIPILIKIALAFVFSTIFTYLFTKIMEGIIKHSGDNSLSEWISLVFLG